MKIEIDTKFDIGDEVWFIDRNSPRKGKVVEIKINESKIFDSHNYDFYVVLKMDTSYGHSSQYADVVFATKRELIESLMNMGDKEN